MVTDSPALSGAENEISSSSRSIMVCRRRAPIFSALSFTSNADFAICVTPSSVNSMARPSVFINALYCTVNAASGSVNIRSKSSAFNADNSTRIGKRPCSSGIRSLGLVREKAPDAINNIWSVFTMPYLVDTVQPSTNGNRSRCTPSRDTSAPPPLSARFATLSISSIKTIPFCSAFSTARVLISSSLSNLPASSSRITFRALSIRILLVFLLSLPMF